MFPPSVAGRVRSIGRLGRGVTARSLFSWVLSRAAVEVEAVRESFGRDAPFVASTTPHSSCVPSPCARIGYAPPSFGMITFRSRQSSSVDIKILAGGRSDEAEQYGFSSMNGNDFRVIKRPTVCKEGIVLNVNVRPGRPQGCSNKPLLLIVPLLSDEFDRR